MHGEVKMCSKKIIFNIIILLNIHASFQCPIDGDVKAAYKSGDMLEQSTPITLDNIKLKLLESGIFDLNNTSLDDIERKELNKLFDVVEIMTTSRNRQPQNVQNMFSYLRMMERIVKKQLKEGQISEKLAAKFHWEKLSYRQKRDNLNMKMNMKMTLR